MKDLKTPSETQLMQSLYGQNQTNEKPPPPKGISPSIWMEVWSRLEAAKVIWEELDSTTSEYWRVGLDGYDYKDLMRGCDGADCWTKSKADFGLGAFKFLCRKPHSNGSYKPFVKALPNKPIEGKELQSRLKKMREGMGL